MSPEKSMLTFWEQTKKQDCLLIEPVCHSSTYVPKNIFLHYARTYICWHFYVPNCMFGLYCLYGSGSPDCVTRLCGW